MQEDAAGFLRVGTAGVTIGYNPNTTMLKATKTMNGGIGITTLEARLSSLIQAKNAALKNKKEVSKRTKMQGD